MTDRFLAYALAVSALWLLGQAVTAPRRRQLLYLLASYVFYLGFGLRFFLILLASSLFNFLWGRVVARRGTFGALSVGAAANLLLLGTFKYLPPLAGLFASTSGLVAGLAHLVLPVGVSFWTFQGLSYLIDEYRGEDLRPSLLEFLLYVAFAPTVSSGPITRLTEMLPQLRTGLGRSQAELSAGIQSVWAGLLMIGASRLLGQGLSGEGVDWGFGNATGRLGGGDAWVLLAGYGFQLFFDFAGYSRVVIGIARMFGIRLPENFRRPFLSVTTSEFWTRWHMSLSFWIRDYLFLPLAAARPEVWWRNAMLVLSMVAFGLWHRASVLFLLWGLYQGSLLLGHRLIQQWQRRRGIRFEGRWASGVSWLTTFVAMTLGWALFRAADWGQASALLRAALWPFAAPRSLPLSLYGLVIGVAAAYFVVESLSARLRGEREVMAWIPAGVRYLCYGLIFYAAVVFTSEPQPFIYVQF
jgi:alginate O-acetyltransferase complex protein AlgI